MKKVLYPRGRNSSSFLILYSKNVMAYITLDKTCIKINIFYYFSTNTYMYLRVGRGASNEYPNIFVEKMRFKSSIFLPKPGFSSRDILHDMSNPVF